MRLVYVIDSLAPGGAEMSLAAMAPHLSRHGVELHVAYLSDAPGLHGVLLRAGAELHEVGGRATRFGRTTALRSLVRRIAPDLVHTTLFEADVAGRAAAFLSRTPVVSSLVSDLYGPAHLEASGLARWKLRAAQSLDAATAQFACRFHAITNTVKEAMAPRLRFDPKKIDVVYRGRDAQALGRRTDERRRVARRELGVEEGQPVVLAVGRQERPKGLDVLIQAVPALVRHLRDVRVVIAGRTGNESARLTALVDALGVGRSVRLLGHRLDVAELLCAADVFVFPSRWEGLGGAMIEAMALECPIVASDLPVLREVAGADRPCALFAPPENPAELAAQVLAVLGGEADVSGLTAAGRRRFEAYFTVERAAEGMRAFYERALSG